MSQIDPSNYAELLAALRRHPESVLVISYSIHDILETDPRLIDWDDAETRAINIIEDTINEYVA